MRIEQRDGRYVLTDGFSQRDPTGAELEFWMRLVDLEAEIPKALYLTRLNEVMGRGVMAEDVAHIAEVLRRATEQ